ncbi:MAG: hypothetical protein OXQ94_07050 [Gemmatimonadota bacterium]|nr:hypothetical protein [Gemmatimonadota bacterium]
MPTPCRPGASPVSVLVRVHPRAASFREFTARPPEAEVPIPYPVAEVLVIALGAYGAAGVVFAVPFAWRGAGALDPAAGRGTWGFRLLTLPGAVALWPLLLAKWRRAAKSGEP